MKWPWNSLLVCIALRGPAGCVAPLVQSAGESGPSVLEQLEGPVAIAVDTAGTMLRGLHLRAAADTTNLEATHAALLAASNRQLQGLAATERLLELLAEWDNFQSVLSLTRDILNRQQNLLERTRPYAKEN